MLAEFGFADSEFGCLNALWNRLGLWGTVAQARSGLAYIKGRYGTPCAAWDHVQGDGRVLSDAVLDLAGPAWSGTVDAQVSVR